MNQANKLSFKYLDIKDVESIHKKSLGLWNNDAIYRAIYGKNEKLDSIYKTIKRYKKSYVERLYIQFNLLNNVENKKVLFERLNELASIYYKGIYKGFIELLYYLKLELNIYEYYLEHIDTVRFIGKDKEMVPKNIQVFFREIEKEGETNKEIIHNNLKKAYKYLKGNDIEKFVNIGKSIVEDFEKINDWHLVNLNHLLVDGDKLIPKVKNLVETVR